MTDYTALDIHRMRVATRRIMQTRMLPGVVYMSDETHFTSEEEMEARLNTYITAGITPQALEDEADRVDAEWDEVCKRYEDRERNRRVIGLTS